MYAGCVHSQGCKLGLCVDGTVLINKTQRKIQHTLYRKTQYPVAAPCNSITFGITFLKFIMYLLHFTLSTVLQNVVMPSTSSCIHFGLTSLRPDELLFHAIKSPLCYSQEIQWCFPPVDVIIQHEGNCHPR